MKHKTAELTGALLDAAVAKAEGREFEIVPEKVWGDGSITIISPGPACRAGLDWFEPSTNWAHGGPIMERNPWCLPRFNEHRHTIHLGQYSAETPGAFTYFGPSPLIAAMRAYVASKLGDEVEL